MVNSAIDEFFGSSEYLIIAEPGRFFVSSAYTLACRIHSKRAIVREGIVEHIKYFINDGVYSSFNCILYDHKIVYPKVIRKVKNLLIFDLELALSLHDEKHNLGWNGLREKCL